MATNEPIDTDEAEETAWRWNPISLGTILVVLLGCLYFYIAHHSNGQSSTLDYTKPIYTAENAIICPQTLLIDPRNSGDSSDVTDLFNSITQRKEKASSLGCEVLKAGLPVFAHRMAAPYEKYVALSYHYGEISTLFTKEEDLNNIVPDHPPYPPESKSPADKTTSAPASPASNQ